MCTGTFTFTSILLILHFPSKCWSQEDLSSFYLHNKNHMRKGVPGKNGPKFSMEASTSKKEFEPQFSPKTLTTISHWLSFSLNKYLECQWLQAQHMKAEVRPWIIAYLINDSLVDFMFISLMWNSILVLWVGLLNIGRWMTHPVLYLSPQTEQIQCLSPIQALELGVVSQTISLCRRTEVKRKEYFWKRK